MKKKVGYLIFLLLVVTGLVIGFIYRENVLQVANEAGKNIEQFKKTDLVNGINQMARQIVTPGPLNIGGSANATVLTKAKIVAQTNMQRYNNGTLPPLTANAKLDVAALAKANDLFKNQYFEHVSLSGVDPGTLVKNAGYDYIVSAENLILGNFKDEAEVVQKWMDSPGHRANILNDRVVDIGVAIIKGTYKGQTVWIGVQEFGLPLSACPGPSASLKTEIENNKIALEKLSMQIDVKREEIDNTNRNSSQYNQKVDEYNVLVGKYNDLNQKTKNLIGQYNVQVNNFNACVES